jgi:hypothetical protein
MTCIIPLKTSIQISLRAHAGSSAQWPGINLRAINVTPHVTQNNAVTKTGKTRNSAIDERTTRHPGYGMSQSRRAMAECIFGWGKQHGTMRKTKHRGIGRVAADFLLNLIAYNLIRIPKLIAA